MVKMETLSFHIEVNGVRQSSASGIALSRVMEKLDTDKTIVAKYFDRPVIWTMIKYQTGMRTNNSVVLLFQETQIPTWMDLVTKMK